MGRKLHFRMGSFYRTDDRTGFPQRAERTKKEWTGSIVDERLWEPRQPQDLVRGVPDFQSVPDARPLAPNSFVGPIWTTLTADVAPRQYVLPVAATTGFAVGQDVTLMLANGVALLTVIVGVGANTVSVSSGIPYGALSGAQLTIIGTTTDIPYITDSNGEPLLDSAGLLITEAL